MEGGERERECVCVCELQRMREKWGEHIVGWKGGK